jgi:hypothetical protein
MIGKYPLLGKLVGLGGQELSAGRKKPFGNRAAPKKAVW